MRESPIERALKERVEAHGGMTRKLDRGGGKHWKDRLIMLPGIPLYFVELKAPGKEPTRAQAIRIAKLRRMGHRVEVIDSIDDARALIDNDINTRGHHWTHGNQFPHGGG